MAVDSSSPAGAPNCSQHSSHTAELGEKEFRKQQRRRQGSHEQRDCQRLFALAKPVRQVENDTGEKAGFGYTEQKTRDTQLGHAMHESGGCGHDSPRNQNASDPNPRPDPVHQQIAGNLTNDVADEEDSRDQPKLLAADAQFPVHRQCSEAPAF